jgi:large subunit ribosomal protein L4
VEDFSVESGKTRDLMGILKNFGAGQRTVLILRGEEVKNGRDDREEVLPGVRLIKRAGKNIPWLSFLSHNRLRAHDLFYGRNVILTESAAKNLNAFYKPGKEAAE